ncbi:hypothetical protein SynMEDNS5_01288 [Synechococcus sp. MEDNS5]|nr:hypothetical protein SynMEDNS5_01288 [Synechococcus sp. MEDNS5]
MSFNLQYPLKNQPFDRICRLQNRLYIIKAISEFNYIQWISS